MGQQPSVGRVVHYRGPGTANGQFQPTTYPAIITAVHGEKCVSLFVMTAVGMMNLSSIMQAETSDEPSRWSWPPHVPATPDAPAPTPPEYQPKAPEAA